jgi:hypothetical protein
MKKLQFLVIGLFFASPLFASAAVGLGFGGLVSTITPCACSGGYIVWFTPLYINSPVPVTGGIYYSLLPPTLTFSWYEPGVPATWELGTFAPGVQQCLVPVVGGCAIVPDLGSMNYVGTSGL